MADEPNPQGAAVPAATPGLPDISIASVPASAMFGDEDSNPVEGTPPGVVVHPPGTVVPDPNAPPVPDPKATPAATPDPKATPAAPDPKATPAATPDPKATPAAPEPKVKVAGKEYTVAELEKLIANPTAATPAAPAAAAAPVAPAAPALTPEQVTAQENEWCDKFLKDTKLGVTFSKEDVEKILEGGDDAAKILSDRLNPVLAKAVLETRKSVYADLNPYFERANAAMLPILEQQMQLERIGTEQVFVQRHPDFSDNLDRARAVAEALMEQYPTETQAMTREQFVDEVASQTDRILQADYLRFNPGAKDTWKDALKAHKAAAAPAATPAAPAATPGAPAATPAAPAATPAAPAVRAPNANHPAATPTAAGNLTPDQKWHRDTAASLAD